MTAEEEQRTHQATPFHQRAVQFGKIMLLMMGAIGVYVVVAYFLLGGL